MIIHDTTVQDLPGILTIYNDVIATRGRDILAPASSGGVDQEAERLDQ